LLGENGWINQGLVSLFGDDAPSLALERTFALILIAHVFYNCPIALRMISTGWANQNPRIEQAARVLGVSGWRLWWWVRLPIIAPYIFSAGLLVFIFTFTSFGVIIVLGGISFATVEVEIYRQALNIFNLPVASALSLLQITFMAVLMTGYNAVQRRNSSEITSALVMVRTAQGWGERLLVWASAGGIFVLLITPLVALIARSFWTPDGWSMRYYVALSTNTRGSVLFAPPIEAIGTSVAFAALTVVLAGALGMIASYLIAQRIPHVPKALSRAFDTALMLPLATSAVTLGFGFIVALDTPPLNLRTSPLLIPIAHALIAMPFVIRSLVPAITNMPLQLSHAGLILGASRLQVFRRVELPILSRPLMVAATFSFTVSMGEFGATTFIARPDIATMPTVIFRLLGQPGSLNYGQAVAMSSILLMVCACGFLLIERFRTQGVGEF
jgi:thiamine transport system permease protein